MGLPRITFNSKTIDLPKPPYDFRVEPVLPRKINISLTGVAETIRQTRVEVPVHIAWRETQLTVANRRQLDNLNQWAQQGNTFRLQFDSAKSVSTTLNGGEALGETVLAVTSATGIVVGQQYVIKGGPNYQLVAVTNVASNNVTVDTGLDYTFASGAVFRDRYLWDLMFREERSMISIRELGESKHPDSFDWTLDAWEVAA